MGIFGTSSRSHNSEDEIIRSGHIPSGYQIIVGPEFSVRFTSDGSIEEDGFNLTIAAVSKRKCYIPWILSFKAMNSKQAEAVDQISSDHIRTDTDNWPLTTNTVGKNCLLTFLDCQPTIESHDPFWTWTEGAMSFPVENVLIESCDDFDAMNYWLAPNEELGSSFVVNRNCPAAMTHVRLKNTNNGNHNDRWDLSIYIFPNGMKSIHFEIKNWTCTSDQFTV